MALVIQRIRGTEGWCRPRGVDVLEELSLPDPDNPPSP